MPKNFYNVLGAGKFLTFKGGGQQGGGGGGVQQERWKLHRWRARRAPQDILLQHRHPLLPSPCSREPWDQTMHEERIARKVSLCSSQGGRILSHHVLLISHSTHLTDFHTF